MAKFLVDKALCISCGVCVSIVPDVFYFGDDGSIETHEGDGSAAIAVCPVGAISE